MNWTRQPGRQVDLAKEMQRLTLRIVAKALFNVDLTKESSAPGEAFEDARDCGQHMGCRWYWSLQKLQNKLKYSGGACPRQDK